MTITLVSCFDGGGKHVVNLLVRSLKRCFELANIQCNYVTWDELLSKDDWSEYEHLLSLDKVGFTKRSVERRKGLKGKICSIEHLLFKRDNFVEDIIFYTIPKDYSKFEYGKKYKYMGWAADSELCYPKEKEFVFIDHPYYKSRRSWKDYSHIFRNCCYELSVNTLFLDSNGIEKVEHNRYKEAIFDRYKNLPYETILDYYRKASVFVVTHREILGWSVLEAAMCGAVILLPSLSINPQLLPGIPNVQISNMNDSYEVKDKISEALILSDKIKDQGYKEREELVKTSTWKNLCNRIVKVLDD